MTLLADWVGQVNTAGAFESAHQPQEAGTMSDVTASRSAGTVYQNTSGKKRRVFARASGATNGPLNNILAYVDSFDPPTTIRSGMRILVNAVGVGATHLGQIAIEVPRGHYYKVEVGSGDSLTSWMELDE